MTEPSTEPSASESHPLCGQQYWLTVEDDDLYAIGEVQKVWKGQATLRRQHAPSGVRSTVVVDEADVQKLPKPNASDVASAAAECDDLVALEDPNERAMLHALRERYERDVIFTSIGPVLVVVNPYRPVASCAAASLAQLARFEPEALPAHAFSIASAAYSGLVDSVPGCPQSILVSGESGAGKTETTKLLVACLALVSSSSGAIVESALESGLLLEAFGNAKTVYNHNSSRFGKWCAAVHSDDRRRRASPHAAARALTQSARALAGARSTSTTAAAWRAAA